jgi:capsular polysaccharide export protein
VLTQNVRVPRSFLFLQGPTNFLFAKLARRLRAAGHEVRRVNVCVGDRIFWRGPGSIDFRGSMADWPHWLEALFDREGSTDVVLLGEKRERHRAAIEIAHRRGIEVTVTDFGYFRPDWVVVERDGLNGDSRFPRDAAQIRGLADGLPAPNNEILYPHRPVNQALWDMTFNLSSAFMPWPFPHFTRHTQRHPLGNYLGTAWRLAHGPIESTRAHRVLASLAGRRYFVFAMQMEDDFSLRAYSRFPDMASAMGAATRAFATHAPSDAQLVFKVHPLDPGLRPWRRVIGDIARECGVETRVHYIDGGDLDGLLRSSAGLVTVNSTTGVRAIEIGVPVLALGQAVYSIPGIAFTSDSGEFWHPDARADSSLRDAFVRALAASVHVRGSMYDHEGIEAAADGMAYRLHHGLVNAPLAAVLKGERIRLDSEP